MATSPTIRVHVRQQPTVGPVAVRNPAKGQKLPFFKAAVRRTEDRGYVPRYDLG